MNSNNEKGLKSFFDMNCPLCVVRNNILKTKYHDIMHKSLPGGPQAEMWVDLYKGGNRSESCFGFLWL